MDRLSRIDPGRGLAMRRGPVGRCRQGSLLQSNRVGSQRPLVQLYWGALTVGAAFGAMLAEATPATEQPSPFEWYPLPGEAQAYRLPSIARLPVIPLPARDDARDVFLSAVPIGPPQRLRKEDAVDERRLGAVAFDPAPLGEPQPLSAVVPGPTALFAPAPLGPARPLELPVPGTGRATADLALSPAPLGPPRSIERPAPSEPPARPDPAFARAPLGPLQRLQLAQAYPRSQYAPDPLGPPQRLQIAQAYSQTPFGPHAMWPPQPFRPPQSALAQVLSPNPLGPPQRPQIAQAYSQAPFGPSPMWPPQQLRPPQSSLAQVLVPAPLGPPQRLRPETPVSPTADPAPSREPVAEPAHEEIEQAMAPPRRELSPDVRKRRRTRDPDMTPLTTTGSVRTAPTVSVRDGMVVIRVRY